MTQVYNFSSGPAMLPAEVLRRAEQELTNWQGLGTSVMEISHRSKEFIQVAQTAEQDFRDLLNIPSNYKVLFCHGGGRGQFAAVPGNLLNGAATRCGRRTKAVRCFSRVGAVEEQVTVPSKCLLEQLTVQVR